MKCSKCKTSRAKFDVVVGIEPDSDVEKILNLMDGKVLWNRSHQCATCMPRVVEQLVGYGLPVTVAPLSEAEDEFYTPTLTQL